MPTWARVAWCFATVIAQEDEEETEYPDHAEVSFHADSKRFVKTITIAIFGIM